MYSGLAARGLLRHGQKCVEKLSHLRLTVLRTLQTNIRI